MTWTEEILEAISKPPEPKYKPEHDWWHSKRMTLQQCIDSSIIDRLAKGE